MSKKGRPVVAVCQWRGLWFNPVEERIIEMDPNGPPVECRASLGDKKLTVWLPQGARIRLGLSRARDHDPMTSRYSHVYGSFDRGTRTRIRITLKPVDPQPEPSV